MRHTGKGRRLDRCDIRDYVVFDLETTGVRVEWDAIIEISALRVEGGQIAGRFSTLVNPGRPIPKAATAVNGITDRMVADAPDMAAALTSFLQFIGTAVLVGHNIHAFDMPFLCRAAEEALGREIGNDYIDTLPMARRLLPGLRRHRLTDVSQYFGIRTEGAHRALADCTMNQQCYEALRKLAEKQTAEPPQQEAQALLCPRCGSRLVRRNGRYGEFYGCSAFPGCRYTRNA